MIFPTEGQDHSRLKSARTLKAEFQPAAPITPPPEWDKLTWMLDNTREVMHIKLNIYLTWFYEMWYHTDDISKPNTYSFSFYLFRNRPGWLPLPHKYSPLTGER